MEKQKQRISVPKLKEASESKRLHSRLNTLQIPRDQPEDIGDDENSNVGPLSIYTRSRSLLIQNSKPRYSAASRIAWTKRKNLPRSSPATFISV